MAHWLGVGPWPISMKSSQMLRMAKRWPRSAAHTGSHRSRQTRRWRRCCPQYRWVSSARRRLQRGSATSLRLMAQRPDLYAFYDDPRARFRPQGFAAGNAALSQMFGSPEASRAIAAQAQNLSGVTSAILKKLLPVIVGMIISGLMRSGSGRAAPQAPQPAPAPAPDQGGGLIDILRQIFQQGGPEAAGRAASRLGVDSLGHPSHRRHSRRT